MYNILINRKQKWSHKRLNSFKNLPQLQRVMEYCQSYLVHQYQNHTHFEDTLVVTYDDLFVVSVHTNEEQYILHHL